jgi:hypothetical protein
MDRAVGTRHQVFLISVVQERSVNVAKLELKKKNAE